MCGAHFCVNTLFGDPAGDDYANYNCIGGGYEYYGYINEDRAKIEAKKKELEELMLREYVRIGDGFVNRGTGSTTFTMPTKRMLDALDPSASQGNLEVEHSHTPPMVVEEDEAAASSADGIPQLVVPGAKWRQPPTAFGPEPNTVEACFLPKNYSRVSRFVTEFAGAKPQGPDEAFRSEVLRSPLGQSPRDLLKTARS
ncbi:hypothetical protein GUJ93_ZPchr0009g1179 [Zizania palustris]|uniref:Uncharacterized protein n=1 Tax=Zizania palustris TaxID=103762 RepID=A0A8J5S6C5_ZIZPA|nr:hypothetical protein GUJ93_ZPchr0009g1179 [Zizania palustris]